MREQIAIWLRKPRWYTDDSRVVEESHAMWAPMVLLYGHTEKYKGMALSDIEDAQWYLTYLGRLNGLLCRIRLVLVINGDLDEDTKEMSNIKFRLRKVWW